MRTKHNPGHGVKGSAAFKPFLTEYRFSFKDPAPTKGKFSLGRRDLKGKLIKPQTAAPVVVAQEKEKTLEGFLPPIPIRNAPASAPTELFQSTSLTLPGMVNGNNTSEKHLARRRRILEASAPSTGEPTRYNIITGVAVDGEPSSGFKEGRRAFVRTFAHFDAVTNERTPGYNIITGSDATKRTVPPLLAGH